MRLLDVFVHLIHTNLMGVDVGEYALGFQLDNRVFHVGNFMEQRAGEDKEERVATREPLAKCNLSKLQLWLVLPKSRCSRDGGGL